MITALFSFYIHLEYARQCYKWSLNSYAQYNTVADGYDDSSAAIQEKLSEDCLNKLRASAHRIVAIWR